MSAFEMARPPVARLAGLTGLGLLLSACSIAPSAVMKSQPAEENAYLATDARLRIIASTGLGPYSRPGQVDPVRIVCPEPSPDVATVVATSFSAGVNALGYGNAAISSQQIEGMMSLVERTASIQLLRDKMYQTCMAYSNGAISGTSYAMIMGRLDETILSFLLGETAGGAFGRSGGALGTDASAEASATMIGLPAAVQDMVKIGNDLKEAQSEADTAQANLKAAKAELEKTPDDATKKTDVATKEAAAKAATDKRDQLMKSLQNHASATAKATGSVKTATGVGALSGSRPTGEIAATLRDMQDNFLSTDLSRDVVSACMVEMATQSERRNEAQIEYARAYGEWDRLKQREISLKRKLTELDQKVLSSRNTLDRDIGAQPAKVQQAKDALAASENKRKTDTDELKKITAEGKAELADRKTALEKSLPEQDKKISAARAELKKQEDLLAQWQSQREKLDPVTLRRAGELQGDLDKLEAELAASNIRRNTADRNLKAANVHYDVAGIYHERIFNQLDDGLNQSSRNPSDFGYYMPNMASIAARERTTSLARFCFDGLPTFMTTAQDNNLTLRRIKAESQLQREKEQTERAKITTAAAATQAQIELQKEHLKAVMTCNAEVEDKKRAACLASLKPFEPPAKPQP